MCNVNVYSYNAAAYQNYCALFDKSTKIGTHVDYYLTIMFGYGGTHNCTHGSYSNNLQNGCHANDFKHTFRNFSATKESSWQQFCTKLTVFPLVEPF